MSSWSSRWTPFASGSNRWSPWGQQQPTSTYYPSERGPEHDRREGRRSMHDPNYSHSTSGRPSQYREPSPPPRQRRPTAHESDIILISFKGTQYPIHFKPYSVDDGDLTIAHIRDAGADAIPNMTSSRMKMFMKGRKLDDDRARAKDMGFSSKAVDRVLVTEATSRHAGMPESPQESRRADRGSEHAVDESSSSEDEADGSRVSSNISGASSKSKKKNKKKKKRGKGGTASEASSSAYGSSTTGSVPYPTGGAEYLPMPTGAHPAHRGPSPSSMPTTSTATPSTTSSRSRSPHPAPSSTSAPASNPQPSSMSSNPQLDKLESIAAQFHTTLMPKCATLLESPPADKDKRKQEASRLTLTIEQNIVLKYDGIEHNGDEGVRARRKELIKEAQMWLGRLDEAASK